MTGEWDASPESVAVIGAGAWGTTLAALQLMTRDLRFEGD